MAKDYGIASYSAARVTDSLLLIAAVGVAPNWNTRVTLEQLPWRIWPPHFALYFDTPDVALPALRPFAITGLFLYPASLRQVTVIDARGRHSVEIGAGIVLDAATEDKVNAEKAFNAYRQIGVATNCMIAPVDAMVPMIFSKAHGPDTYKGCEDWVAKNCGKG
jgi:hypothetical protein